MTSQLSAQVHSAIMGHLIGDAFSHERFKWSADSAQMLCTLVSLYENDGLNVQDQAEKLYDLYLGGYLIGEDEEVVLTPVVCQSIRNFSNAMSPDQCGLHEESEDDYGAVVRVLPTAMYFARSSVDTLIDSIEQSTIITHQSLNNKVICAVLGLVFRNLLLQEKTKVFEFLADYYKTKHLDAHLVKLKSIESHKSNPQHEPERCFWTAWDIFTKHQFDLKSALLAVPNDSIVTPVSILVGSLVGLSVALDDMPSDWLQTIYLTSEVMEYILGFVELF